MIVLVDPTDARAIQNKNNVLALYDLMINQKKPEIAAATFLAPDYIQHNPIVPDGAQGLAEFFAKVTKDRPSLRIVVHRIIATGEYVWAHVNVINLFNDNPQDLGIAGVDIFRLNAERKAIEHWDVLQEIGNPEKALHANGMF